MDTNVDLPAPLRPTSACASPCRTLSWTPLSAVVAPKRFVTPVACTAGAAPAPGGGTGDAPASMRSVMLLPSPSAYSEVVAPEGLVVDVVLGHEWCAQLILEHTGADL